jgi:hypothetical protein
MTSNKCLFKAVAIDVSWTISETRNTRQIPWTLSDVDEGEDEVWVYVEMYHVLCSQDIVFST